MARCGDCERLALAPATDGYDEVLLEVGVDREAGGHRLSADEVAVIDTAPTEVGYHPMPIDPALIDPEDHGRWRWLRVYEFLVEYAAPDSDVHERFERLVDEADEVPPDLARAL